MMHYTCDRCHREMADDEQRFVIKLEAFPELQAAQVDETADDRDHLEEISDMLEALGDDQCQDHSTYRQGRYDLCRECFAQFVKNPLAREPAKHFDFSEN